MIKSPKHFCPARYTFLMRYFVIKIKLISNGQAETKGGLRNFAKKFHVTMILLRSKMISNNAKNKSNIVFLKSILGRFNKILQCLI